MSHGLKGREQENQEKENSLQVKRQTVDLLPDAHNNLAKLQVRRGSNARGDGGSLGEIRQSSFSSPVLGFHGYRGFCTPFRGLFFDDEQYVWAPSKPNMASIRFS